MLVCCTEDNHRLESENEKFRKASFSLHELVLLQKMLYKFSKTIPD